MELSLEPFEFASELVIYAYHVETIVGLRPAG